VSGVLLAGQGVDDRGYLVDAGHRADDVAGVLVWAFEDGDEDVARGERPVTEAFSDCEHVLATMRLESVLNMPVARE